jgi:hypothetical protein
MALTENYGGFGHVNGVNYFQCCRCQICHFEDEAIYSAHIMFQSKHGIFQMSRVSFERMRGGQAAEATAKAEAATGGGTIRLAGNPLDGARATFVKDYPRSGGVQVKLLEGRGRYYAGAEVILKVEEFERDADLPAVAGSC